MRSVGFPRKNKRVRRPASLALTLTLLLLALAFSASATAESSFLYCLNRDGAKIFAGREEANGSLKFGISVWSPTGQNISVFGLAIRRGRGWRYTDNLQARTVAERCQLDIMHGPNGMLSVTADRSATCQSHGGADVEINIVKFPPTAYEGAVTTELDDPEAFQKAGKCISSEKS